MKIDYVHESNELGFYENSSPSRDLVNEVSRKLADLKA